MAGSTAVLEPTRYPGIIRRKGTRGDTYVVKHGRLSRAARTLEEARRLQAELVRDRTLGNTHTRATATTTLDDLFAYLMRTSPPRERKTIELYQGQYRRHIAPVLGRRRATTINTPAVKLLLADLVDSGRSATAEQVRRILHRIFAVAVDDGLLDRNPVTRGSTVRVAQKRTPRVITREQLNLLANECEDGLAILLLGWLGLRIGEALALEYGDFDFSSGVLHIKRALKETGEGTYIGLPKMGKQRIVVVPDFLAEAVRSRRDNRERFTAYDQLFLSSFGTLHSPTNWRKRVFAPAARRAGLEGFTPHMLRHTAATLWLEAGISDFVRQDALGHAALAMTSHYTHLTEALQHDTRERISTYQAATPSVGSAASG